jgi:hypothetical protein
MSNLPFFNKIYRRSKTFRKKYIIDLTPDQEQAFKEFLFDVARVAYKAGVDVASESISKTINGQIAKQGE